MSDWVEDFTSGGYDSDFNYGAPGGGDVGVILNPDGTLSGGSGIGAVTGTSAAPSDWTKLLQSFLGKASTPAGAAAGLMGLYGLMGGNKPSGSPGWRGKIDPNKYTYTANKIAQPAYVPYSGSSAPVMGRQNFQSSYSAKAAGSTPPIGPSGPIEDTPAYDGRAVTPPTNGWGEPEDVTGGFIEHERRLNDLVRPAGEATVLVGAAAGGLMGFAGGGQAKSPRYLQGATDGMADKLSTSIDGEQPAALSHGEFVIPADVVSHLGNGNSEAGADQLYKMMDRVRKARTGNKKQGKRINPEKFTPGGIAGYAGGGVVAFNTGNLVTTGQGSSTSAPVTSESNLSEWAAPGVTNYLEKGMALASSPYQAYTGPLTAGTSPLQQQAFTAASNLQAPATLQQGANMIQSAGTAMGALQYNPTAATNQFSAPGAYQTGQIGNQYSGTGVYSPTAATNQFSGPGAYQTGQFGNQYSGTGVYSPTAATNQYTATGPYAGSNIGIDQFNTEAMQRYMNPYMQMSLDPQLAEARRQSEITQMGNASKLAQAGAYGGSRGALMQSEAQRNLGTNLANITGQGYNTAYDKALSAFGTQQGLGLQAQQANEASRQFGANQALTNAQNRAQFGQSAQAQNAQQQQFAAQQALANAQNAAQYGLAGQNATEASRQFGASQGMTAAQQAAQYGQAAQAQNAQERQFGAQQALANAQNAAQYGLAGLNATEASRQFGASQGMTAAQQAAQYGQAAQMQNMQQQQFGANYGLSGLQGQLSAGTALGGLGMQQGQLGLANLNALAGMGSTQRGIEQEGIDALYKQYEQERLDPYKQIQFQQSLFQGLPVSTVTGSTATSPIQQLGQIGSGMGSVYNTVDTLLGKG